MKKRLLVMLVAGLAVIFTACGGGGTAGGTQQETENAQEQQEEQTVQEPENTPGSEAEPAGADSPVIENPQEPEGGPSITGETVDPDAVPGGDNQEIEEEANVWNLEGAGLLFTVPKSVEEARGVILQAGNGEAIPGSGVMYYAIGYLGVAQDEYADFVARAQENEPSDEEVDELRKTYRDLFTVYCIDGNRTEKDLRAFLESAGITEVNLEEMEKVEEYTFFFSDESSDKDLEQLGEYEEEYRALVADLEIIKNSFTCIVPVKQ